MGSVRVFVVGWARLCGVEGRRGSGKFGGDVAVRWSWVGQMWRTVRVEGRFV